MTAIELLRELRLEFLPDAKGNCECGNCKRHRRWLAQIDEVLKTESESEHAKNTTI